ncbi:MAG: nicotinamide riboside transporter PnuC [Clostridia bacterium]|nr:nicotinamide riboside transporter PnuC [Clostridia bacterium]
MIKKVFGKWNAIELIFYIVGLALIITMSICFGASWMSAVTGIFGLSCVLFAAKGKIIGIFFTWVMIVFYSILSYKNKYYGEVFINLCMMFPMTIIQLISWLKNLGKDYVVKVNSITKKEIIIVCSAAALAFVAFYFILRALNTSQLIFSTISIVTSVLATYFQSRRSKYGFLAFLVNDAVLCVLWLFATLEDIKNIAMLTAVALYVVSDIYGFISWGILQKRQQKDNTVQINKLKKDAKV